MFIGAASLIVIYICMGLYMMNMYLESNAFSNPLWYGLVIIFWPISVLAGLWWIVKTWITSIVEYYKEKGEKKE